MSVGKLTLLLIAGGLAGAAFATMSAGPLRAYRQHEAPVAIAPATQDDRVEEPVRPGWLDEGLSALDSPAWPFGRGEWDNGPPAPEPLPDGYAPYDQQDGYERGYDGSYRAYDEYPDAYQDGRPVWQGQSNAQPAPLTRAPQATPRAMSGEDHAADAAQRAADAAQDVLDAEKAP